MKNWQRWVWVTAWIGWLLNSWCSAQVSPQYALPGGTVTWRISSGSLTSGKTYPVMVGTDVVSARALDPQHLSFAVPKDVFAGVVPVRLLSGGSFTAEMVVVGLDALVGHSSRVTPAGVFTPTGEVTVDWLECNSTRSDGDLLRLVTNSLPGNIKVIKPPSVRSYALGGDVEACRCRVVEVSVEVSLTTTDPVTRANVLGSVLEAIRGLHGQPQPAGSTSPEPLIVRSAMTHALYIAGPDHVPLTLSENSPIDPVDVTKLKLPTPGSNKVLVAILDTGLSPTAKSKVFKDNLLQQKTFTPDGSLDDRFNVQAGIPGFPLNQGSGHGTPVAWIVNREAGKLIDILPISVCDKEGLCRDPQVMQGLCYAAKYYREHQKLYPGGLVINLSLGSFTPSDSLRVVLDDVTMKLAGDVVKPWVVAAAGNYIPDETKRRALGGNPAPPIYIPGTPKDWNMFTNRYPYAMVFPAGFGVDSSVPGVPAPLFTANDHIVGVGSLEHLKKSGQWPLTDTSMRGRHVKVCAPGRYVMSRDITGTSAAYSGTSYAAPVFTGLLATVLSRTPTADWSALSGVLQPPIRTVCP